MRPGIRTTLILLTGAVFLLSGYLFLKTLGDYRQGQVGYEALEQYVSAVLPTEPPHSPAVTVSEPEVTEMVAAVPQVDFLALAEINPDVAGWICLDGTNISYPFVQGQDNDHYLTHLFDGTKNRAGCIFMDYRCSPDLSDVHTIIYGHHLRDGTMFTELMSYKRQEFYDAHPTGLLLMPDGAYMIRFFAGYVSDNDSNAWDLELDPDGLTAWIDSVCRRSYFSPESVPGPDDRIVTLSTCTYEFEDAKFVLHGYLERYGG